RVQEAQNKCEISSLPKKVINRGNEKEKQLVYIKNDMIKKYLPKQFAKQILWELHIQKGHLGSKHLEIQFTRKYYTPCLSEITKEIVLECEICAKVKLTNKHYGTLGIIGPAAKPYEIVHIDTKSGFSGLGSVKIHLH